MQRSHALALVIGIYGAGAALPADAGKAQGGHEDPIAYIGTHGNPGPAPAGGQPQSTGSQPADAGPQGIYAARLDTKTGHLSPLGITVELQRATWLVTHPSLPVIYSVADSGGGMGANSNIYSFKVDPASGKLQVINKVDAGGRDATAMDLDARSNTLFVANHGSGSVSALPLLTDGSLGPVTSDQKDYGTGPHPRQKSPSAHGVAVDPTHKYVLVADFSADRIFSYHFNSTTQTLSAAQPPFEPLPAGSGPRHLLFHRSGRFLLLDTELSAELRSYSWNAKSGRLHLVQTLSPYPADYSGEKSAAEIAMSRDGRFAYLSLRGDQNSIVVYAINEKMGTLQEIQRISAQGKNPWSFGIDPTGHWMLVTNETSNSVVVLEVDPGTGKLTATGESLTIPKPVTVAFYSR
jgi:6-phosphogluconolactonase